MTHEEWLKDAQAGIDEVSETIEKTAASGDGWGGMDDNTRQSLVNALIGGGLGATILGGAGAMTAPEGESRIKRAIKYGLLGGAGGAVAGGAGTTAYNLLTGGRQLPGEIEGGSNIVDAGSDALVGGLARNPMLTAGALGGAGLAARYGGASASELLEGIGSADGARTKADDVIRLWRKGRGFANSGSVGPSGFSDVLGKADVHRGVSQSPLHQLYEGGKRSLRSTGRKLSSRLPGAQSRALRALARAGTQKANIIPALNKSWKGKWALGGIPLGMLLGYAGDRVLRGGE